MASIAASLLEDFDSDNLIQDEHDVVAKCLAQILRLVGQGADQALSVADLKEVAHHSVAHERVQREQGHQQKLYLLALTYVSIDLTQEQKYL